MRNAALGLICAAALALALSDFTIFGIAIWKIELAVVGLMLFVTAGKKDDSRRKPGQDVR
jgi:hypothetical protein